MADRTINWVFRATDKTDQAFRSIDSKLAGINRSLKAFAGFAGFATVAAGISTLTRDLLALGGELADASQKLGISAEQLQVLKFAAEQTGASFDGLQAALAFNTKLTEAAVRGNQAAAETFRLLGLDAKKFAELPIDRRLAVIADQLSKVEDPALRLDLNLKALGRGAADLTPLLSQGSAGLKGFEDQLRSTNSIISNDQVAALDKAGDEWDAFLLRLKVRGVPVLTTVITWVDAAAEAVDRLAEAIKSIPQIPLPNGAKYVTQPGRGATGRWEAPGAGSAVIGAAGTAQSDAQIAAVGKASAAALGAQRALADEAARVEAEVLRVTDGIAALGAEANRYFSDRGKELSEQYRAPLDVLTERIREVNDLFAAGVISTDVANAAVQDYADTYAAGLDRVADKNIEVKDSTTELLEALKLSTDGFARDLTDAFFDATQSIGDYFEQLAVTIAKALFTQEVTSPLIRGVLGSFGSSLDLDSLFGGARAAGGPVAGGRAYLVGERGPELFVPGGGGQIVPNGATAGEAPIAVNLTITSVDPTTAAATIAAQERLITGMVRRATLRAGRRPVLA